MLILDKHFVHQEKLFLEEFDKSAEKIVEIFSKEEILEAQEKAFKDGKAEGYKDGFNAGKIEAISEHEKEVLEVSNNLNQKVRELLEMMECYNSSYTCDFFDVIYEVFKKILPYYMKNNGKNEIQFFVKEILSKLLRKEGLRISVHEDIQEDLLKILKSEGIDEQKLEISTTNINSKNQASLDWVGGGARINIENVYEQMNQVFENIKKNMQKQRNKNVQQEELIQEENQQIQ